MIGKSAQSSLSPVGKEEVNTLVSWIRNEEDLSLWSGNTFRDGFSAHKMRLHLNRTDLDSFASLDKKSKLLCYADIVRKEKRNQQLNQLSNIYFNKIKKDFSINEL